jgi:hypothetical protein
MGNNLMEKRIHDRLPSKLQARLVYGNLFYAGSVTNFSEKGVFLKAKMNLNVNSVLVLVLLISNRTVNVLGKVKRAVKQFDHKKNIESGMGVELLNPPVQYLEFVKEQRIANDSVI